AAFASATRSGLLTFCCRALTTGARQRDQGVVNRHIRLRSTLNPMQPDSNHRVVGVISVSARYHIAAGYFMSRGNPSPKLAITIDPKVHEKILAAAATDGVSVSAWMT